jgi:hypothetical protein
MWDPEDWMRFQTNGNVTDLPSRTAARRVCPQRA